MVEPRLIPFFTGEFVVIGVVVDELKLAAPGIVVFVFFDGSRRSGVGS